MKKILIFCESCSAKCKLRECDQWGTCNRACANIMTPITRENLRRLYKIDLDNIDPSL